jgi:hypothetical protein
VSWSRGEGHGGRYSGVAGRWRGQKGQKGEWGIKDIAYTSVPYLYVLGNVCEMCSGRGVFSCVDPSCLKQLPLGVQ